jgi:hypothetical protein
MGGKNSMFRKPLGAGSSSVNSAVEGAVGKDVKGFFDASGSLMAGNIGGAVDAVGNPFEQPELEEAELSPEDLARSKTFAGQLDQDISGNKNSLAIAQYKQAQQDGLKSAMALGSSVKGVSNPALMARNVAQAADGQGQALAQDSAMMKMQERQNALQQMNSYIAAKEGVALNQANMANQANIANSNANKQLIGGIGGAAATVLASDKNNKKNIKKTDGEAGDKAMEMLSALDAYSFEYKDRMGKKGEHAGIMAQDLEKTEAGEQMVKETPEGKVVDFAQGFGLLLAAQTELKKELDEMKKKKVKNA